MQASKHDKRFLEHCHCSDRLSSAGFFSSFSIRRFTLWIHHGRMPCIVLITIRIMFGIILSWLLWSVIFQIISHWIHLTRVHARCVCVCITSYHCKQIDVEHFIYACLEMLSNCVLLRVRGGDIVFFSILGCRVYFCWLKSVIHK